MASAAYAASQVRKTPVGGLRDDVARLISLTNEDVLYAQNDGQFA